MESSKRTGALAPTSSPRGFERRLIAGSEIIGRPTILRLFRSAGNYRCNSIPPRFASNGPSPVTTKTLPIRIRGRAASALPNSALYGVGRDIESPGLLQRGGVVSEQPAVIGQSGSSTHCPPYEPKAMYTVPLSRSNAGRWFSSNGMNAEVCDAGEVISTPAG